MLFRKQWNFVNALILALAIMFIFAVGANTALADKLLNVPFFSQKDPAWKDEFLDNSPFTIGHSGCALTSATMVVSYYGADTDPLKLNEALTPIGGIDTDGNIHWDIVPQVCEGKVEWIERIDGCKEAPAPCWDRINSEIEQGYPVIMDILTPSQSQHFVVMWGKSGNDYHLYDPGDFKAIDRIWPVGRYGTYEMVGLRIYHGEPQPPPLADWPYYQKDLQNTGNNSDALTIRNPKLGKKLLIENASAYAQPVVSGDIVYIAAQDGFVYAANPKAGYCIWGFNTGAEEIKVTPALVGNKLYILDSNNILWCLDKRTGDEIWKLDVTEHFGLKNYYWQTAPEVWQNYVCFTVGPYAIFIKDNIGIARLAKKPIQIQGEPPEFMATSAISEEGIFYCFNFACQIIAFKIETGEYLWHWSQFPGPKDPAGLTYLGNPFAIVLADDVLILKNNWRYDFKDTVAKQGETGWLYAVDRNSHDKILWKREIGLSSCPSVYKDNILYSFGLFARQGQEGIDGIIYPLDPKTGNFMSEDGIYVNDDVRLSIGGDIMYLSCWTFKKVFAVIFDPFEILWQREIPGHPFSAVVPVQDKAFVSMLDIQLETTTTSLWPDAKTRSLATSNIIISSFSESYHKPGDVSGNGTISGYDGALILQHIAGLIKLNENQQATGDVDKSGGLTPADARLIIEYVVGVIDELPMVLIK